MLAKRQNVYGSIILSTEGINCGLSGKEEIVQKFINQISNITLSKPCQLHINYSNFNPFAKFKIKIKPEIVSIGSPNLEVLSLKGKYIEPQNWEDFIARDDVAVIDVRNDYEFKIGHFAKAINPETKYFRDFASWLDSKASNFRNKKVAMYCTGGIRCEKATAYLKHNLNFAEGYQLEGGILKYLQYAKNGATTSWQGDCFVFDERISIDKNLQTTNMKT